MESEELDGSSFTDQRVQLTRGASYLMVQNLGASAVAVVAFAVLARLISTKDMGILAILQLVSATCLAFGTWFPQSVTKYVAENFSRGFKNVAASAFYQALSANLIFCIPVAIGIYVGAPFLADHLLGNRLYMPLFRVFAFDVFFFEGMLPILTAALLGLRMFRETAIVGVVVGGFARQSIVIVLLILLRNLVGLPLGWLISDAVTAVIYLTLTTRVLGSPRFDFPLGKLFRYYLPLELSSIVTFAKTWFDRALLAAFVSLTALGVYNAAVTAYGVAAGVSSVMYTVLFPVFSSIQTDGRGKLSEAIRLSTRYACFLVTLVDLLLLATAKAALTLFVGESYVGGTWPLIIFCAADAATAFATALGPALLAMEETNMVAIIAATSATLGLGGAYVLLPEFGIVGASIGRASAIILSAILQFLILKSIIGLRLDSRIVAKTILSGATMATVVVVVQMVGYSKFLLPLYAIIGVMIYLIMFRLLKVVDSDDLRLLGRILGNRLMPVSHILGFILLDQASRELTK
ncbi:MAG TPA: oligosaccharide flippase family protein [Terriglobales bacterium]|nr:oligosaccharide flippase family protein [Terriglobales bacterium]